MISKKSYVTAHLFKMKLPLEVAQVILIRSFQVEVSSHGFQLCHIIKCGNEIMNETIFLSKQFHVTVYYTTYCI
jgi:hypothetical protein